MPFVLAVKKEMTTRWKGDGAAVPVTKLSAAPCIVTEMKSKDRDGYTAVQIGCLPSKRERKSLKGKNFRYLKEFRVSEDEAKQFVLGTTLDIGKFRVGDTVQVTGWSKGKGFAGVMKRHHFHGHPASHGTKDSARAPGSIGQAGVQRVFKGVRMAGRMGGQRVTVRNLEIIDLEPDKQILMVKGAVPGAYNGLLLVTTV